MAIMKVSEYLAQLVYPPRCILCGQMVPIGGECGDPACAQAFDTLRLKGDARRLENHPGKAAERLDGAVASFIYTGAAAELVARYKFGERKDLCRSMARLMAEDLAELMDLKGVDAVLDVPAYRRGTEHARLLAKQIARELDLRYEDGILAKTKKTEKQHEQVYRNRMANIRDAFTAITGAAVAGKTFLVCDDVLTSGHTLNMCADALKKAGAARVYGAVFCVTVPKPEQAKATGQTEMGRE